MKRIISILLFLILLCPLVMAQEQIQVKNAGITPDSVFYNLDRALEELQLRLTQNKEAKTRLQLRFLDERVQEIKQMIQEKKQNALEIAISERNKIMNNLETESKEEAEETRERIRERLELHTQVMEKIGGEVFQNQISNVIENNNQLKNKLKK